MTIRHLPAALSLPLILSLSLPSQAFVGGIAVSMGRATNTEGAEVPPFSADAQIESDEHQAMSRVYFQPGMVRDETDVGGMTMVTIQRYDTGKVWVLMSEGMHMETDIGQAEQSPDYELIERTMEGTEVINGETTTKYKTVYEGPEGRFAGFTWFTKDNIAIKGFIVSETEGEKQRLKWTMTNVQRGDQPDELFELPPGSQEMGGMQQLMDLMGGGAPPGASGEESASQPANTTDAIMEEAIQGIGNIFGR
jgi:hypothetical protein